MGDDVRISSSTRASAATSRPPLRHVQRSAGKVDQPQHGLGVADAVLKEMLKSQEVA